MIKIRRMLDDVSRHAREDVIKVADPKARALFETTAEVLDGLAKAYEHAEQKSDTLRSGVADLTVAHTFVQSALCCQ